MWQKIVSVVMVLGLLALAGCVVSPAPPRHARVHRPRVVVRPAPVVVRPGPVVIVP